MSAYLSGTQVILEADGIGWHGAKKQLAAPPASADQVIYTFRHWVDDASNWPVPQWSYPTDGGNSYVVYGWDPTFSFGICFRESWASRTSAGDFLGLMDPPSDSLELNLILTPDGVRGGTVANIMRFFDGGHTSTAANWISGVGAYSERLSPGTPAAGAQFTGVLKVRKSGTNQISISVGRNMESLPLANLRDAATDEATVWYAVNELHTDTTNWRPAPDTINFPRWIQMRWPAGHIGMQHVFAGMHIDYYNYNSEKISESEVYGS